MNIKQEIKTHAAEVDKPALLWLFSRYSSSQKWDFVAQCSFKSYGKASYQSHRIWKPTAEGYILYKYLPSD